ADRVARPELCAQDPLGQRILDLLLDRPLQRPRTIDRVVARLRQPIERRVLELEANIPVRETAAQVLELDVDDPPDVLRLERVEHDDVVDPVDELRTEMP